MAIMTYNELLAAKIDLEQDAMAVDRACMAMLVEQRNIHDFNEIVTCLKKHSSSECLAFASDLIGFDISIEDDAPKAEKKPSRFWQTLKRWWIKFKLFVKRLQYDLYRLYRLVLGKLKIKKDMYHVSFTTSELQQIIDCLDVDDASKDPKSVLGKVEKIEKILKDRKDVTPDTLQKYLELLPNACKSVLEYMGALELLYDFDKQFKTESTVIDKDVSVILHFKKVGSKLLRIISNDYTRLLHDHAYEKSSIASAIKYNEELEKTKQ